MSVRLTSRKRRERLAWYDLESSAGVFAVENGLAEGDWFRSDIPRKRLKELMQRTDGPAIRDTSIWLGLMLLSGAAGAALWGSWWALPFFIVYGLLYGTATDSRWHETGHGTAFRTRWMDETVYQIASFCQMRNPVVWRWSHVRHHTDTLIVGRDPEIAAMRPLRLAKILLDIFGLYTGPMQIKLMIQHAFGSLTAEEKTYVPDSERSKAYLVARIWIAIYVVTIATAIIFQTWLPVVLIGGPRFYGVFMHTVYYMTQHAGLSENVLDHRLNTRTVLMNPINRFLYWNMNYHIEHHMFPMVPFHQLSALHEEIKKDTPAPYPSLWAAYREIIPAVLRQLKDQTYFIKRELPPGAAPYHGPSEGLLPKQSSPA